MALDDYVESEVAIAVAATAAVLSPRVRGALHKGAVYGLAGVLVAGDAIGAFARGVGRGAQNAATATTATATGAATAVADAVRNTADDGTATTPEDTVDRLEAMAQNGDGARTTRKGRRSRPEQEEATADE